MVVIIIVLTSALAGAFLVWWWRRGHEANLAEQVRASAAQAAQERLAHEFKTLADEALRTNRTDFLEQAKQSFGQLQQQTAAELDQRKQAVENMIKPLRESLDKVDGKIAEIEKARATAYGALGEQLKALQSSQLQLQNEAARLSSSLRSTTYAGSWGEMQLRRVVEMADMLPYCDFTEQETAGDLRADLVIRLPGGQRIVVDAKTPLESYRAVDEATDEITRTARMAEHALKIRGHVDTLGAKSYWERFQPAPEFVVLFLPGDHFLTAALRSDPTLLDRALSRRVLLATPTTLIALLKAAAYGWRQESVSKNAEEISALGRQLYDRVATFADHFAKVGGGLETAVRGYNSAVGSLEQSVLSSARRFAELGAKGTKELAVIPAVETSVREVVKKS